MFSNRFWLLKVAAALLVFGIFGRAGDRILENDSPQVERVAVFTEDLRGKTVTFTGRKVLTADAAGFEIQSRVGPIRVLTSTPPPVGAYVSASARPTGTRTLMASSLQINAGWEWKRPLNYGLSVLVLLAYLWSVRRLFRWPASAGVFRGRY